jgi:hypothetical protein
MPSPNLVFEEIHGDRILTGPSARMPEEMSEGELLDHLELMLRREG